MKLVLDAGALVALERNDRRIWRRLKAACLSGHEAVTHAGVLGQVWRGAGPRHALLAMALAAIDVRPLDRPLGKAAGELLAASRTADVIDASVVLLAEDGDFILTSDVSDLVTLAEASGRHVEIVPV